MLELPTLVMNCSIVEFAPITVASKSSPVTGSIGGRWLLRRMCNVSVFGSGRMSSPWRFNVPSPLIPEKFSTESH
jgi:hypothetical protein